MSFFFSFVSWRVPLFKPLAPKETRRIGTIAVYADCLSPLPATIGQNDLQSSMFAVSRVFVSAYETTKQTTAVLIPGKPHKMIPAEGFSQDGSRLTHSSTNVPRLTNDIVKMHFDHSVPYLKLASASRLIELSHWANNLAVEDHYDLRHQGAQLEKPFSRVDFSRAKYSGMKYPVVESLRFRLPADANNIYYRDVIGNISTSRVMRKINEIEFEVSPRFPLHGGWKTSWFQGYNEPLSSSLKRLGSRYALNVQFFSFPVGADLTADEFQMEVVLPEGAKNIKVDVPFPVDSITEAKHYSYLDTTGRPKIVIRARNVVPDNQVDIQIGYDFSSLNLLQEPVILIVAMAAVFLFSIGLLRSDFTIKKDEKEEQKEYALECSSKITKSCEMRADAFRRAQRALDQYKEDRGEAEFDKARRELEVVCTHTQSTMADLVSALRKADPRAAELASELTKLESDKLAAVTKTHAEIGGLLSGRMAVDKSASVRAGVIVLEKEIKNLDSRIASTLSALENL